jgi:hypothetical protein
MSVAVSSAFAASGTHPIGVSSIPDPLFRRDSLRYSPWTRLLPSVVAEIGYFKYSDGKPFTYMYEPPAGIERQNCEFELISMPITDARNLARQPKIDVEGFELWEAPTEVADFRNDQEVTSKYYAEASDLVRGATGASMVIVFDHQVRQREAGRPSLSFGRAGDGSNAGAVGRVHVDYSEETGHKRLNLVLQDQGLADSIERFAIVNVWRSIKGPILDTPLALCDARSVGANDLVAGEIRYQTRSGEIYLVRHSNRHRWHYYSAMNRNEALIFKQYDSLINSVSRFTPHAAFDHPDTREDTPLRESIEVRCLAIFD